MYIASHYDVVLWMFAEAPNHVDDKNGLFGLQYSGPTYTLIHLLYFCRCFTPFANLQRSVKKLSQVHTYGSDEGHK